MSDYLARYDAAPEDQKYPLVRGWIDNEPLPFFKELREKRPILVTPAATLVARLDDCLEVLNQPKQFTVALYKPKMADYLMAHDDDAMHTREKSIMYGFLNRDDLPRVRKMVGKICTDLLKQADGRMELIHGYCRTAPAGVVRDYFGLSGQKLDSLIDWSYWNQVDTFHNQPFDLLTAQQRDYIKQQHDRGSDELGAYIKKLLVRRLIAVKFDAWLGALFKPFNWLCAGLCKLTGGTPKPQADDVVTRMLRTTFPDTVDFGLLRVGINAGGLLIGAIETTCQAVAQALQYLFDHPEHLERARAAAKNADTSEFDAVIWECTRFVPISPYLFRETAGEYTLAKGTDRATVVKKGDYVMPLTLSAMFDEAAHANPDAFEPGRALYPNFLFGYGEHECLGKYVGMAMIPEMLRQLLLLPELKPEGRIAYEYSLPKIWKLNW
jgi:cytochrome P450